MKILQPEEAQEYRHHPRQIRDPEVQAFFDLTQTLEVGQAIHAEPQEVPNSYSTNASSLNVAHQRHKTEKKFSFRALPYQKGYVFIRVI